MKWFRFYAQYIFAYRDSIVGIATLYGLDDKEFELGGSEVFPNCPDRLRVAPNLL